MYCAIPAIVRIADHPDAFREEVPTLHSRRSVRRAGGFVLTADPSPTFQIRVWATTTASRTQGHHRVSDLDVLTRYKRALHHLQLWMVINVPDCVDAPPYVAVTD
jgi:hypothetical protein